MTSQSGSSGAGSSPVTTPGDLIVGNAAGIAVRLAKGADNTLLMMDPVTHLEVWGSLTASKLPVLDKVRYVTGSGQALTNSTQAIVNFDTQYYDSNALVTTGTAWKFTAKVAGQYRVSATIYLENTTYAVGNQAELFLYKNNAEYSVLARPELQTAGTYRLGLIGDDTITLAVADTIDVRVQVFLTGVNSSLFASNFFNYVSIEQML